MKKKIKKGITIILIGGIVLMQLFGCSVNKDEKVDTNEEVLSQINEYLNEKYGYISYELVNLTRKGWDIGYDELIGVEKEDGREFEFRVTRQKQEDGYLLLDTYFEKYVSDEIEEKTDAMLKEEFGEGNYTMLLSYFTPFMGYSKEMTEGKTFEDAIQAGEYNDSTGRVKVAILYDKKKSKSEYENMAKEFQQKWEESYGVKAIYLFYFLEEKNFEKVTADNYNTEINVTDKDLFSITLK